MDLAPREYRVACLRVLDRALLRARLITGWNRRPDGPPFEPLSSERREELGDLLDAVHDIPAALEDWHTFKQDLIRSSLDRFDERWGPRGIRGSKPSSSGRTLLGSLFAHVIARIEPLQVGSPPRWLAPESLLDLYDRTVSDHSAADRPHHRGDLP